MLNAHVEKYNLAEVQPHLSSVQRAESVDQDCHKQKVYLYWLCREQEEQNGRVFASQ